MHLIDELEYKETYDLRIGCRSVFFALPLHVQERFLTS